MGPKIAFGLWKPRYLFFPEKTLPTIFCLIHPEFTIHVDWPQESTQTHKFIHHETDPQYGGRCVGCAYFVNSDDHQILLVQLQVVWLQSNWIIPFKTVGVVLNPPIPQPPSKKIALRPLKTHFLCVWCLASDSTHISHCCKPAFPGKARPMGRLDLTRLTNKSLLHPTFLNLLLLMPPSLHPTLTTHM